MSSTQVKAEEIPSSTVQEDKEEEDLYKLCRAKFKSSQKAIRHDVKIDRKGGIEIEDHYLQAARRAAYYRLGSDLLANVLAYSSVFAPIVIYQYTKTRQLRTALGGALFVLTGNLIAANIFSFQLYEFTAILSSFYKNLFLSSLSGSKKEQISIFSDLKVKAKALELKYFDLKIEFSEDQQKAIERRLDLLEKIIFQKNSFPSFSMSSPPDIQSGDQTVQDMELLLSTIETIMSIPRQFKKLSFTEIKPELDQLLQNYGKEVQDSIKKITGSLELSSRFTQQKLGHPLYLQGPNGSGRRFLAKKYADTLGLPFLEISLAGVTLDQFIGKKDSSESSRPGPGRELSLLSRTLSSLPKKKNYLNFVLFIKNFDELFKKNSQAELLSFLTDMFTNQERDILLHDLGIHIDVSKVIFIFSGSSPIRHETLHHQMQTIIFSSVEKRRRVEIACSHLGALSSEEGEEISDEFITSLLQLAEEDDHINLGVRPLLKTVEDFVSHRLSCQKQVFVFSPAECAPFHFSSCLTQHTKQLWNPTHALDFFEKRIQKEGSNLPPNYEQVLQQHLVYLRNSNFLDQDSSIDSKDFLNYFKNLDRIFNLPRNPVKISDRPDIQKNLDEALKNYPEKTRSQVLPILKHHISSSHKEKNQLDLRSILYFFGKPGTGKTHLAQRLQAITGLHLIKISLADASANDLLKQSSFTDYSKLNFGDGPPQRWMKESGLGFGISNFWRLETLSRLSEALVHEGASPIESNAILFFDEADKVLNERDKSGLKSLMLDFLSPNQKTVTLSDLGVRVDTSRFLVILAGNEELHEKALMDRVSSVEFEGYDRGQKEAIAWEHFQSFFEKSYPEQKVCLNQEPSCEQKISLHRLKIQEFLQSEDEHEKSGVRQILQKTCLYAEEVKASYKRDKE